jgi:drug/metabolite transporter (DMT)-like permease
LGAADGRRPVHIAGGRAEADQVAAGLLAAVSLAVAVNPLAVRFSNRELDPLWGVAFRFALASALLAGLMVVLRLAVPRGRALVGSALFGVLTYAAALGLAYYAFVKIHAGIGQIVFGLVPLATLLLAVLQRQENMHVRALVGALLAVVGVGLLAESPGGDTVPLLGIAALVGSVVAVAEAAVVVKHFPSIHPVTMNTIGSGTALVIMLPLALLAGDSVELPERAATWAAITYLVVVAQILMPVLYLVLLGYWPASRVAYVFVISPFLTVALSAWLDDEPVGAGVVVGGLVTLAGVYVGALRPRPEPVTAVPPP